MGVDSAIFHARIPIGIRVVAKPPDLRFLILHLWKHTVRKDGAFFVTDDAWRWALLAEAKSPRYIFFITQREFLSHLNPYLPPVLPKDWFFWPQNSIGTL
jgi:hypothetical protein